MIHIAPADRSRSLAWYHKHRDRMKEASRLRAAARRAADPEGTKARAARWRQEHRAKIRVTAKQYLYGTPLQTLQEMLAGSCAVCGAVGRLNIDHDHACCSGAGSCGGCVRGALCSPCNKGLGNFRDDPALLQKAIDYLTSRSSRRAPATR